MNTTVLHVTDRYTGGVPVAIEAYVRNSPPNVEHHLLVELPAGLSAEDEVFAGYATVTPMGRGSLGAIAAIKRARRRLDPEVVHAHSSFAGAYARVAFRSSERTRIVYTPHCYAFERQDIGLTARRLYRALEWVLSFNVATIAACSEGEAAASRRRGPRRPRVVYVPNVLATTEVSAGVSASKLGPLRLTALGRLARQKDPARFAATAAAIRARGIGVDPVWLGGGPDDDVARLEQTGVRVTGWMPHAAVAAELAQSDVYLHTAAWEGFPLAVLEAVHAGIPTLVRRIDAFGALPDALTLEDGLEALIASRLSGPDAFAEWVASNTGHWARQLRHHTPERQTSALAEAYGLGRAA